MMENYIFIFLLQIGTILLTAKLFSQILSRYGQPSVVGELLAGIVLGPTVLGRLNYQWYVFLFPQSPERMLMIETMAWIGVFFFILSTGFEIDLSIAWKERKNSLGAGFIGLVVPLTFGIMVGGILLSQKSPNIPSVVYLLFIGLLVALPALMVTVRLLYDFSLIKSDLGLMVVSSLAISELFGWFVFAIVEGLLVDYRADISTIFRMFVNIVLFAVLTLTIGKIVTEKAIGFIKRTADNPKGMLLSFVTIVAFFIGSISQYLKIHALFGFFLAGIISGESPDFSEKEKQSIIDIVSAVFVPVFFASIGLKIDFIESLNITIFLIIFSISFLGKFLGGLLSAKFIGLDKENSNIFAIYRIPGGSIEIILGMVGMSLGIINSEIFVAIVLSGIMSTIITSPLLSYFLKKRKNVPITDYFVKDFIIDNIFAQEPVSAIEEIFNKLSDLEIFSNIQKIEKEVLYREKTMPTGIGKGIAIPHARLEEISSPMFFYIRSLNGVAWDSPDGEPVHHIFLILTPKKDIQSQLFILSSISQAFFQKDIRDKLLLAKTNKDISKIIYESLKGKILRR